MPVRAALIAAATVLLLAGACGRDAATPNPEGHVPDAGEQPATGDGHTDGGTGRVDLPDVPDVTTTSSLIPPDSGAGPEVIADNGACVSDPSPRFTHPYTDLEQIEFINPTIVVSGNWLKNRQYHKVVTDADNQAVPVPVYAPTAATAVGITHYLGTMQAWDGQVFEIPQFDVRFEASCEVAFWFDHISDLVEPFASLAAPVPVRDTRDAQVSIQVDVEAGDLIGYTSGTEPAHTWDFVLTNSMKTNQFANQARYEQTGDLGHLLHGDCPFDYFDEPLQSEYRQRFGSWQGSAAGFNCDFSPDVVGTIAGGWFLTPFESTGEFAPADWGFVTKIAADGSVDLNGPGTSIRTLPDAVTFADPKTVTDEHCFQDYKRPDRYAYVTLLSDSELAVAFGDGVCPASLPGEHQVFYR